MQNNFYLTILVKGEQETDINKLNEDVRVILHNAGYELIGKITTTPVPSLPRPLHIGIERHIRELQIIRASGSTSGDSEIYARYMDIYNKASEVSSG